MRRLYLVATLVAISMSLIPAGDRPPAEKAQSCGGLQLVMVDRETGEELNTISVPVAPLERPSNLLMRLDRMMAIRAGLIKGGLSPAKANKGALDVLRLEGDLNSVSPYPGDEGGEGGGLQCYVCCDGYFQHLTGEKNVCDCTQGYADCRKCLCFSG